MFSSTKEEGSGFNPSLNNIYMNTNNNNKEKQRLARKNCGLKGKETYTTKFFSIFSNRHELQRKAAECQRYDKKEEQDYKAKEGRLQKPSLDTNSH